MKTNVTYIESSKFEATLALAKEMGLKVLDQRGFIKVTGPKGYALYVASTKRVGRVDLSGFTMGQAGFVSPHCGPFGNVKEQVDFSLDEETILANFALALSTMMGLAPKEKEVKAPVEKKVKAPKPEAPELDASSPAPKANRLKKIAKVAEDLEIAQA